MSSVNYNTKNQNLNHMVYNYMWVYIIYKPYQINAIKTPEKKKKKCSNITSLVCSEKKWY